MKTHSQNTEYAISLIAVALVVISFFEGDRPHTIWLAVSVIVFLYTTRGHLLKVPNPVWGVRRRPFIDLVVALVGGYAGFWAGFHLAENVGGRPGGLLLVLFTLLGALIAIYVVTFVAAPKTGVASINCPASDCHGDGKVNDERIRDEKRLARDNVPSNVTVSYPLVWPYVLVAQVRGSVIWHIDGPPGGTATIEFDQGFLPFGDQRKQFTSPVPGTISVAPVVRAGTGGYTIEIVDARGNPVKVDPILEIPRG